MATVRKRKLLRDDGTVWFPAWVRKPSPCKTVTNKIVVPRGRDFLGSPHGAMVYYDTRNATPCVVSGLLYCHERSCELHYMSAPLNLRKGLTP